MTIDKPTEGFIKDVGVEWGANKNPHTWTIKRMVDKPTLFKIVDDKGINVATDFTSERTAQHYLDYNQCIYVHEQPAPAPAPAPAPTPSPIPIPPSPPSDEGFIDTDGVKIIFPINSTGPTFSLQKDGLAKMSVDCKSKSMQGDRLVVISRTGGFASRPGVINYTSRTHVRINSASQITGLQNARSAGSMIPAPYFRDMEITVLVETLPAPKERWIEDNRSHNEYMEEYNSETHSVKFGGNHSDTPEMALSNTLNLPYIDKTQGSKGLWARETTHPKHTFQNVKVLAPFPGNGPKLTGLKGIRYDIPGGVHYESWYDADPKNADGSLANNWIKAWEYNDTSSSAHTFGVRDITYRADMAEKVIIHKFNVRSIKPRI